MPETKVVLCLPQRRAPTLLCYELLSIQLGFHSELLPPNAFSKACLADKKPSVLVRAPLESRIGESSFPTFTAKLRCVDVTI
ncbi:MAG: hypothetical protein ACI8TQ_002947 [Planctomycetota bacterium]|jgi:hypothetical protein